MTDPAYRHIRKFLPTIFKVSQLDILVHATETKPVTFAYFVEAILNYLEKHVSIHHLLLL